MANFWTHAASNHSLYLYYVIYELPLCKILYQYINIMDTTYIFPFIAIFGPIGLGIIANIASFFMNHQYAKFHVIIKKLTIDVIFRRL